MPSLILLATEAAAEAGDGNAGATIAVVILLLALAAFAVAYLVVGPGRRRGPRVRGDIPLAMRPYHSDEELETTGLERAMAWGVALAVFSAVFLPLYWLIEPSRINDAVDDFYKRDVTMGRQLYAQNCVTCHGPDAEGGTAPHPDPDVDAPWPAPQLNNIAARYEDSEIVEDLRQFIVDTIRQGRPGTPMPAWSSAFAGPMNDQQVETIADYILSIQTGKLPEAEAFVGASGEELFANNCARCHGQDAQGRVGPQLVNLFERYGADPDRPETLEEVREHIVFTLETGRLVPGATPMPSFSNLLTPDQMQRIVDYLESIQQTGGPSFGQIGGDPRPSGDDDSGGATADDTGSDE